MDMDSDYRRKAIESFLELIAKVKGQEGQIQLWVEHQPDGVASRNVIASGSRVRYDPHGLSSDHPQIATRVLHVGESYLIRIKIPWDGYLSLFNFGTSGMCRRILPYDDKDQYGLASRIITIPSAQDFPDVVNVRIKPPTSKEYGMPERLFAVVTRAERHLNLHDLAPGLPERPETGSVVSKGFSVKPQIDRSKLFTMETNTWEYGLLEMFIF